QAYGILGRVLHSADQEWRCRFDLGAPMKGQRGGPGRGQGRKPKPWWQLYWAGKWIDGKLEQYAVEQARERSGLADITAWQRDNSERLAEAMEENRRARRTANKQAMIRTWEKVEEVRREATRNIDREIPPFGKRKLVLRRQRGRLADARRAAMEHFGISWRQTKTARDLFSHKVRQAGSEGAADMLAARAE